MALKILLADDSMTAQNMGKKILVDAGYDVVAVSNGAAAIKKIASDRPDVIILDVYMPGYTGLEVCERVKAASETARTPVLLTVGKMEPFKPEDANRVHADGVMIKPFEATDLIAAIQNIGQKIASGPAATAQSSSVSDPSTSETTEIPAPKFDETLRLSAEELRAIQDKTYPGIQAQQKQVETLAEIPVAPVTPSVTESAAEPAVAAFEIDSPAIFLEEPASDASAVASVIEMEPSAQQAGGEFFAVTPVSAYPLEESPVIAPAMFVVAEEGTPAPTEQPVFEVQQTGVEQQSEPKAAVESIESEELTGVVTAELEVSSGPEAPAFVGTVDGLEMNAGASVEIISETEPELEVNGSVGEMKGETVITVDPALVTDPDEIQSFVTKFAAENAEEVHVGIVSDLPTEQIAALTGGSDAEMLQTAQGLPVVGLETKVAPVVAEVEPSLPSTEGAAIVQEVSEAPATSVLDQIGGIEAEAALSATGPMVAYVPGFDDTQPIASFGNTVAPNVSVSPVSASEPDIHLAQVAASTGERAEAPSIEVSNAEIKAEISEQAAPEQSVAQETDSNLGDVAVVTEERAMAAAVASSGISESAASAAVESGVADEMDDSKLSGAISRALERLRPQLIAEIVKELTNRK